jgi:uncharacterized repeat protein (TIGR04138 family)
MTEVDFADEILERLKERNPRFHPKAYIFVLSALQHSIERLEQPRHLSGTELAEGVRRLALREFGPMARTVLEHWGVHATEDMGEIVFALVEAGILVKEEDDRIQDFRSVYDFAEAFEQNYPWKADG